MKVTEAIKRKKGRVVVMRAFIAVEINNAEVLSAIKKVQEEIRIDAKPVDTKNMHFTLLFLGEITEDTAVRISELLKTLDFRQFDIGFEGIGAFPKPKFPRVVWVGVKEGADELVCLARSVEERLQALGFKADKPFKPHMTMFRIKNRLDVTEWLAKYAGCRFGTQRISEIKLKKSVLTPSGPVYSDLEVIPAR